MKLEREGLNKNHRRRFLAEEALSASHQAGDDRGEGPACRLSQDPSNFTASRTIRGNSGRIELFRTTYRRVGMRIQTKNAMMNFTAGCKYESAPLATISTQLALARPTTTSTSPSPVRFSTRTVIFLHNFKVTKFSSTLFSTTEYFSAEMGTQNTTVSNLIPRLR